MKRIHLLPVAFLITGIAAFAQEAEKAQSVRGVNPADNLTKFEMIPKFTMLDAGQNISLSTLTLKYDKAFKGTFGLNFDIPLAYFDSPLSDEFGNGDLNVRGRYQHRAGRWTFIAGAEAVFPVASDDTLGSGKFQLNPTVVGVYAFSAQTFAALAAKHAFSIAGESDRADIVQGQYRLIVAHTTSDGWWFLADPQLWVDYERENRIHFAAEFEVGRMVTKDIGVWLRGGGHVAGDWDKEDWTISAGIRFISF